MDIAFPAFRSVTYAPCRNQLTALNGAGMASWGGLLLKAVGNGAGMASICLWQGGCDGRWNRVPVAGAQRNLRAR